MTTATTPLRKTDLIAQVFSSNPYFDNFYLHFRPEGCGQADRLTVAGNQQYTGYHNIVLEVLALMKSVETKRNLKNENLTVNIVEEHNPIHDDGRITNEGVTKVGTLILKRKTVNA